jgi:hypothetical protein
VEYISWRPGATSKDKALGLAYVDPRCYQDRLNEVLGLSWSSKRELFFTAGTVAIIITISVKGTNRSGSGEEPLKDPNAVTTADAQAFKRACVEFGMGAYLYSWGNIWAEFDPNAGKFGQFTKTGISKLNQTAYNLTQQAVNQWQEEVVKITPTEIKKKVEDKPTTKKPPPEKKVEKIKPNGKKDPRAVKVYLLAEAAKLKQRPINTLDVERLVPLLNGILGSDDARKVWLKWTYDIDSSKHLTGAQKDVLWRDLQPSYTDKKWIPSEKGELLAVAIRAMYKQALLDAGQTEMELDKNEELKKAITTNVEEMREIQDAKEELGDM